MGFDESRMGQMFFQHAQNRIESFNVADLENHVRTRRQLHEFASVRGVLGDWFLDRHMFSARDIFQKPFVGLRDALTKWDSRLPAESAQFGDVEQLSRCAIWFGRVPGEFTIEADNITD